MTSVSGTSRIRVTLSNDGSLLEVETEKLDELLGAVAAGYNDDGEDEADRGRDQGVAGIQNGPAVSPAGIGAAGGGVVHSAAPGTREVKAYTSLPNLKYDFSEVPGAVVGGSSGSCSNCSCTTSESSSRDSGRGTGQGDMNGSSQSGGQGSVLGDPNPKQGPPFHHHYQTIRPYSKPGSKGCKHRTDVPSDSATPPPVSSSKPKSRKKTSWQKPKRRSLVSAAMNSNNSSSFQAAHTLCVCCSAVPQSPFGPSDLRKTYNSSIEEEGCLFPDNKHYQQPRPRPAWRSPQGAASETKGCNCDSVEPDAIHGSYQCSCKCHVRQFNAIATPPGVEDENVCFPSNSSVSADSSLTSPFGGGAGLSPSQFPPFMGVDEKGDGECPPTPTHHSCYTITATAITDTTDIFGFDDHLSKSPEELRSCQCQKDMDSFIAMRCHLNGGTDIKQTQEHLLGKDNEVGEINQAHKDPPSRTVGDSSTNSSASTADCGRCRRRRRKAADAGDFTADCGGVCRCEEATDSCKSCSCSGSASSSSTCYQCSSASSPSQCKKCPSSPGAIDAASRRDDEKHQGHAGCANSSPPRESRASSSRHSHHKQYRHSLVDNYRCEDASPPVEARGSESGAPGCTVRKSLSADCHSQRSVSLIESDAWPPGPHKSLTCAQDLNKVSCQPRGEGCNNHDPADRFDLSQSQQSNNTFSAADRVAHSLHRNQIIVRPEIHNYDSSGFPAGDAAEDSANAIETDQGGVARETSNTNQSTNGDTVKCDAGASNVKLSNSVSSCNKKPSVPNSLPVHSVSCHDSIDPTKAISPVQNGQIVRSQSYSTAPLQKEKAPGAEKASSTPSPAERPPRGLLGGNKRSISANSGSGRNGKSVMLNGIGNGVSGLSHAGPAPVGSSALSAVPPSKSLLFNGAKPGGGASVAPPPAKTGGRFRRAPILKKGSKSESMGSSTDSCSNPGGAGPGAAATGSGSAPLDSGLGADTPIDGLLDLEILYLTVHQDFFNGEC